MFLMGQASGTAMNPMSWPMPAIMARFGSWNAMFMSQAFIVDTQQIRAPRTRQVLLNQLV